MTPEEIEKTIEQMLGIQRQIQESQLNAEQKISDLSDQVAGLSNQVAGLSNQVAGLYEVSKTHNEAIGALIENSKQQDRRLEQLIGYSITAESDRLDLEERMRILERKVKKLQNHQ